VLIYNGQLDFIINPALTRRYLEKLQFAGRDQYLAEPQHIWRLYPGDRSVRGYIKQAANLTTAVIRNAGHMCPHDQPSATLDLVSRFIAGQPYN